MGWLISVLVIRTAKLFPGGVCGAKARWEGCHIDTAQAYCASNEMLRGNSAACSFLAEGNWRRWIPAVGTMTAKVSVFNGGHGAAAHWCCVVAGSRWLQGPSSHVQRPLLLPLQRVLLQAHRL